jgi:uncharacterized protein (DUF302 family)
MSSSANGIIDKPGNHSVDETAEKLHAILRAKGIALFALVDHSEEAAKVGMKMRPTRLLIFGNPKAGTPLVSARETPYRRRGNAGGRDCEVISIRALRLAE